MISVKDIIPLSILIILSSKISKDLLEDSTYLALNDINYL